MTSIWVNACFHLTAVVWILKTFGRVLQVCMSFLTGYNNPQPHVWMSEAHQMLYPASTIRFSGVACQSHTARLQLMHRQHGIFPRALVLKPSLLIPSLPNKEAVWEFTSICRSAGLLAAQRCAYSLRCGGAHRLYLQGPK